MVYLMRSWILYFTLGLIFMLNLSACAKKQIKKVPEQPSKSIEETKIEKEGMEVEELSIHDKDFSSSQKLGNVYFDFDRHTLSEEARETLATNAPYLKKNSRLEILVEGNCDERGTIAYNLALGQKRASSVRQYYIAMGIAGERIGTISYGEEKPVCQEEIEPCWSQNRRAETKVR